MRLDDWFLTPAERGNSATAIDRRRGDGTAWTEGNHVTVLVDGAEYFRRLYAALLAVGSGDRVHFTDWQGDSDELLDGPGSEVGEALAAAARRGVAVRGLLWRSHPRQAHFAEQSNAAIAKIVNAAGGEVVLDERVRRGGSHHQKLVVFHRANADDDFAFAGGIDLCHGRHDDSRHRGDPQAIALDDRYGPTPPWHDVQLEVHGPAVADLGFTFRERWEDPTPLDHRNPWRLAARRLTREPRRPEPLPPPPADPARRGSHAVQVIRTYPAKRPPYPFAPDGERSIARAYLKAFRRARRLVYVEDQYLWSPHAARALADVLRREPELHVVAVVPRYPDRGSRANSAAARLGRSPRHRHPASRGWRSSRGVRPGEHGGDADLRPREGLRRRRRAARHRFRQLEPPLLDARLGGVVRGDRLPKPTNGNRRIRAASATARVASRGRRGSGSGANTSDRDDGDVDDLLAPADAFAALARAAADLDRWHREGRRGPRPPGHLRVHEPERVSRWARPVASALYRAVLDPDGRPRRLRHAETF